MLSDFHDLRLAFTFRSLKFLVNQPCHASSFLSHSIQFPHNKHLRNSYLVGYIMKQEETNFLVSVTLIQVQGHIGMSILLSGNVFPVCFPLPGHGEPEQKPILGRAYGSC